MTVYRWVSAWGYELLPVAALFGVVRSSGVVGIDEKYVLAPKACGERSRTNDKPAGDMRRWMYVYLAVDVYTYDLLNIAIYAHKRYAKIMEQREPFVQLPVTTLCNGLSLDWPMEASHNDVSNRRRSPNPVGLFAPPVLY